MKNIIIFLCDISENASVRYGYINAFTDLGYTVLYCKDSSSFKKIILKHESNILCIISPEPYETVHLIEVWDYAIPNFIIQWDTYAYPMKRVVASKPYDIQIICHLDYVELYKRNDCKHVLVLPFCLDSILLNDLVTTESFSRNLDIGWVGTTEPVFYSNRRSVLKLIKENNYKTNDITKKYSTWAEMFRIFLTSKIVVNVSRDDFSQDATLRCYEGTGCGALLFTSIPTELGPIGFEDGIHFVGYNNEIDLKNKIDFYLKNDKEREAIANRGKELTLSKHTYTNRVNTIIDYVNNFGATAIKENVFRKKDLSEKYYHLAFTFSKDRDLKGVINCFRKTNLQYKLLLLPPVLILFLKSIKNKIYKK